MAYTPFLAGQKMTAQLANTRIVEIVMDWTDLDDIGNFAAGFSANAAKPPRMRKLKIMGTEEWQLDGRITVAAGSFPVGSTVTMFTFDAGYRPTVEEGFQVYAASTSRYGVRLGYMASGALTGDLPSAATAASVVWLTGVRITNPV